MTDHLLLFVCLACISLFYLLRDATVHAIRSAEIHRAGCEAQLRVHQGVDWRPAWDAYEHGPSYFEMVFDITKWTHRQFYPQVYAK